MTRKKFKPMLIFLTLFLILILYGCAAAKTSSAPVSSSSAPSVSSSKAESSSSSPAASSSKPASQTTSPSSKTNSPKKSSGAVVTYHHIVLSKPAVSKTVPASKHITLTIDATKGNDGVVANAKQVNIISGDTVYSALNRYCSSNNILLSAHRTGTSMYISAIDGVAEFNFGPQSGWIYCVNGKFPSYGCSSYKLNGGENVKFIYTVDDGKTEEKS